MKNNFFKYIFFIVILFLIGYCIYNFVEKKEDKQEKQENVENTETTIFSDLRLGIAKFDTINPILSNNQNVQDISRLIYEPLLRISKDNKIELCLAKEYTKLNETSYLIKIKDNVKWQDGSKLQAEDIRFTIDKLKENPSIYSYNVARVSEVQVIDENTVKIFLFEEIPFFEYNLTFPIMSSVYYADTDFATTEKNRTPVGTGKYKISSVENNQIVLKQNQNWWNIENEECKIETITLNLYSSMGEVYNAFKLGSLDLITTSSLNYENYIGTIGYVKKEYEGREYDYIAFNCASKILSRKEVRKAISNSIDRNNIVASIFNNKYEVVEYPLSYNSYLYPDNASKIEYNKDKGADILQEVGWEYKKNAWQITENYVTTKIKVNLVVNQNNEKRVQVAENIAKQLSEVGMTVNIIKASDSQYQKYIENKNYDMILTGNVLGLSPNQRTYLGDNNLANFNDEEAKTILRDISNITKDETLLKQKYERLLQIYSENMPYLPLYSSKKTLIYTPNLKGTIEPTTYNIFNGIDKWYREY